MVRGPLQRLAFARVGAGAWPEALVLPPGAPRHAVSAERFPCFDAAGALVAAGVETPKGYTFNREIMADIQRFVGLLLTVVFLTGLEAQAQETGGGVFNDYWIQPEVYDLPGTPSPPTVDAKGDLHLQIPLLTVPGRGGLDYPINLSYTAGIKVRQEATWVGLGWQFNPGSITRDPQGGAAWRSGTGIETYNVDFTTAESPDPLYLPDAYFVSIPGHGTVPVTRRAGTSTIPGYPLSDVSAGEQGDGSGTWERGFAPLEWRPWLITAQTDGPVQPRDLGGPDLGKTGTYFNDFTPKHDYKRFVVMTEDGTRYVFAKPTLASFSGLTAFNSIRPEQMTEYYVSAWRLVAILGPDYEVGNGNGLVPDPASAPAGSWVVLQYSEVHTYTRNNGTSCALGAPLLQKVYLREIVTPTHRALFKESVGGSSSGNCQPYGPGEPYPDEALTSIELYRRGAGGDVFVRAVKLDSEELFERYADADGAAWDTKRRGLTAIRFLNSVREEEPGYTFAYDTPNPNPDLAICPDSSEPFFDPEDDFGFFTCRAVGAYETAGALISGRSGQECDPDVPATCYPEASAWSLTSVAYPSGVTETYTYEHDYIDAGSHQGDEPIKVAIPYAHVVGSETNPFGATGGTYHFGCGFSCGAEADEYNYRGEQQGGIRVKRIKRTAPHLPDQQSDYKYYRSMPSGIPHGFFQRLAERNETYFNSASRGGADVYYEGIERTDAPSGTITTTHYTTPLLAGVLEAAEYFPSLPVRYNRTVSLRWTGAVDFPSYQTAVSDNQSRLWGRQWKTVIQQPGEGDVPYSYTESYVLERLSHDPELQILPQVRFDWTDQNGYPQSSTRLISLYWGHADDVVVRADTSYLYGGQPVGTRTVYVRDSRATASRPIPSNFVRRTIELQPNQEHPLVTERTYAYDLDAYASLREVGVLTPVVREDVYEATLGGDLGRGTTPTSSQTGSFFLSEADSLRATASAGGTAGRILGDTPPLCEVELDLGCVDPWDPPGDGGEEPPEPAISPVRYHRASVTTWQSAPGLPVWKPFRTYRWAADAPTETKATFTGWTGGAPGSAWELQDTFEAYDAHGRAVTIRKAGGARVQLTYGGAASDLLESIEVGEGAEALSQSFDYDGLGKLTARTDENGHTWRYRYDEGGRLYETADPRGRVTAATTYELERPDEALRFVETVTYPNGNLLANGSFEAYAGGTFDEDGGAPAVDGWSSGGVVTDHLALETGIPPILGRRTLRLAAGHHVEQTTAVVEAGQELVLSIWARGSGAPSVRVAGAGLTELGRSGGLTFESGVPGSLTYIAAASSTVWQRFWVHVRAEEAGAVTVGLWANPSGMGWWDAVSLTPVAAGLGGEELQAAVRPRPAVAFVDEAGTVRQTVDADGWYIDATERVSAAEVDYAGRAVKAWLPYEGGAGDHAAAVYDEHAATNANAYYDGNGPGPDAGGNAYVQNEYYPGATERLRRMRPPGPTEGAREYVEHPYRPRRFRVTPGEYLTLHEEQTVDLDGRRTITYSDLDGEPVLTHAFADIPADGVEGPGNIDIALSVNTPGPLAEKDSTRFDAAVTQYVPYSVTLEVNEAIKAHAIFSVYEIGAQGEEVKLIHEAAANFVGSSGYMAGGGTKTVEGGFIVFAGHRYEISLYVFGNKTGESDGGVDTDTDPYAFVDADIRFRNDDGSIPMLIRTRFERDAMGQVVAVHSPNAFAPPGESSADDWVTTYAFDTAGRTLATTSPDAGTVRYAYDAAGRLRFSQDSSQTVAGVVMTSCYDALGRLLRQGLAPQSGTEFAAPVPATCPAEGDGSVDWHLLQRYDSAAGLTAAPFGATAEVAAALAAAGANTKGRLVASAYRSGDGGSAGSGGGWQATFFAYDALGRVARRWVRTDGVAPAWEALAFAYDAAGAVTEERMRVGDDPVAGGDALARFYAYDARGRLARVAVATGAALGANAPGTGGQPAVSDVEYAYDVRDGLVRTALGGGLGLASTEVERRYDARGRLTSIGDVGGEQEPLQGAAPFASRLAYTPGGLIERVTALAPYAALGGESGAAALWAYGLAYDTLGRLKAAAHYHVPPGTGLATLDAMGTPGEAFGVGSLAYDANGNVLALERRAPTVGVPTGETVDDLAYAYVPGTNRLASVDDTATVEPAGDWDARPTEFLYDANGNVTEMTRSWGGQDHTTHYTAYDERNLPLAVVLPDESGGTGATMRYRYDGGGQRVVRERVEAGDEVTLAERYVRGGSGAVVGLYGGTAAEALSPAYWVIPSGPGGAAIGRIPALALVRRLAGLTVHDGQTETAEAAERVEASTVTVASGGTLVLRAGAAVVLEAGFEAAQGAVVEAEAGVEVVEPEGRRYYVADHLGSVRAVVDSAGAVVEARDYYPFGLEMPGRVYVSGSAPTREGYTGHELDAETGMNYAGARYYMPALGRWTSTDPLDEYASPYIYVGNNPISLIDPTGMSSECPDPPCDSSLREAAGRALQQRLEQFSNAVDMVAGWFGQSGSGRSSSATSDNTSAATTTGPGPLDGGPPSQDASVQGGLGPRAVSEAQKYVDANPTANGDQYVRGAKNGPGGPVDCSGLCVNAIVAAGGPTNLMDGTGNGVSRIVSNTSAVSLQDVQPGHLLIFNSSKHVGIASGVTRDSGATVQSISFIHSGTSTGPVEAVVRPGSGGYWDRLLDGIRTWEGH